MQKKDQAHNWDTLPGPGIQTWGPDQVPGEEPGGDPAKHQVYPLPCLPRGWRNPSGALQSRKAGWGGMDTLDSYPWSFSLELPVTL